MLYRVTIQPKNRRADVPVSVYDEYETEDEAISDAIEASKNTPQSVFDVFSMLDDPFGGVVPNAHIDTFIGGKPKGA